MDSSHQVTDTTKQRPPPSLHIQTGQMDYKKVSIWCWNVPSNHWQWQLWENSKLHNVQLQKELNEVKSDLESVRSQLETMAIRVSGHRTLLYFLLYSVSYDLIDYKIFKAGTIWQYKTFPGRESEIGIWCWEERKIDCHKEARGIGERTEGLIIVNTETLLILLPLQLLAYSESLTDQVRVWQYDVNWHSPLLQTLNQLRLENNRLREENLALLRVMDKIVKNWTFFFISSLCRGKDLTNTILYYNKSPFYLYRRLKTAVIARSLGPNFKVKYR